MSWPTPLWSILTNPGYPVVSTLLPVTVAECKENAPWQVIYPERGTISSNPLKLIGTDSLAITANGTADLYVSCAIPQDQWPAIADRERIIFAFYVSLDALSKATAATTLQVIFENISPQTARYDIPSRKWNAGWNVVGVGRSEWVTDPTFSWSTPEKIAFRLNSPQAGVSTTLLFENIYAFYPNAAYPIAQIYVDRDTGWALSAEAAKVHPLEAVFDVIHDLGYSGYTREWGGTIRGQYEFQNILSCVKRLAILRGPRDAGTPAWVDDESGQAMQDIAETVPKWRKTLRFTRRDAKHLAE